MTERDVWSARRTAFGNEAQAYAFGRPSYPLDALEWVLPPDATTVLDLAAGTGKVTQGLLRLGLDVVAVEPLAQMRALIPDAARALDGTAEAIPLDDSSVDAVFVGQAFHWFRPEPALAEIARVLRPGGRLGLLWNLDDDSVEWVRRLCELTSSEARASVLSPAPEPPFSPQSGLGQLEQRIFRFGETYDADRLRALIASRSVTILMPVDEREALLDQVEGLAPPAEFVVPMVCEVWRASSGQ